MGSGASEASLLTILRYEDKSVQIKFCGRQVFSGAYYQL